MAHFETKTPAPRVNVWDLGVRLVHWSFVTMVVSTYFVIDPRKFHRGMGYVVIEDLIAGLDLTAHTDS